MASNARIARDLQLIGDLLELQDANPFRVRAYRNAARTVEELNRPLKDMVDEGADLRELPGIGKDLAVQLAGAAHGEALDALRELREQIPPGLLDVVRVRPGSSGGEGTDHRAYRGALP